MYGIYLNLNRCLIFGEKKHYNWSVPIFFGENYRPGILIELSLKTNYHLNDNHRVTFFLKTKSSKIAKIRQIII